MEIGIRVVAENITARSLRHVVTCYFTMVAVDDQFRPCPVPELEVDTKEGRRRWMAARLRRDFRREVEQRSLEYRRHPEDFFDDGDGEPH